MKRKGKFVISLDFELLWGMRDKKNIETYGKNILDVWKIIPKMLEVFEKHKVGATWATVGFLFASSKKELLFFLPEIKPDYKNKNLSPYNGYFDLLGVSEEEDKYHFASKLINLISKYSRQEIASHTFSHYYCLEKGQTSEDFKTDLLLATEIAKKINIKLESLVFPRNQFNKEYIDIIKSNNITSFRGNEKVWFQNPSYGKENLIKRGFRLLDNYINISGHNCYFLEDIEKKEPYNIKSSRFLRPYHSKLKLFEGLRLKRILKSMTYAAKSGKIFHLWWHPHNFGINLKENFYILNNILEHYTFLNEKYGFESVTMKDLSKIIKKIGV